MNKAEYEQLRRQFERAYNERVQKAKVCHEQRAHALETLWSLYHDAAEVPDISSNAGVPSSSYDARSKLPNGAILDACREVVQRMRKKKFTTADVRDDLPDHIRDHVLHQPPSVLSRTMTRLIETGEIEVLGTMQHPAKTRIYRRAATS